MNRSLVVTMLTLPVVGLSLASSQAAAQQSYCPGYCCPQYAGSYLDPTAAYPTAPVYYAPAATVASPAAPSARAVPPVSHRLTSAEGQTAQPVQTAPATPQTTYYYTECYCERCRRQREGGLTRVFRGLWEFEQRKNEFLYDVFFGN
jgi:hypothetical protein